MAMDGGGRGMPEKPVKQHENERSRLVVVGRRPPLHLAETFDELTVTCLIGKK